MRPRKPALTPEEANAVQALMAASHMGAKGHGYQAAAALVSRMRGAESALTPHIRRHRAVSRRWLMRELDAIGIMGKTPMWAKMQARQMPPGSWAKLASDCRTANRTSNPGEPGVPRIQPGERPLIEDEKGRLQEQDTAAAAPSEPETKRQPGAAAPLEEDDGTALYEAQRKRFNETGEP